MLEGSWYIYIGYKILDEDAFNLALIGAYSTWFDIQSWEDFSYTYSLGIGAKGTLNLSPSFALSGLVLYGVFNKSEMTRDDIDVVSTDDVSTLFWELKAGYQMADSWWAFATYRRTALSIENVDTTASGFGLGVEYRL
ncbi:MAG: porin family protein [Firmicutes bacterium]|nr:porin family protein [Bacillota bacterium]